MVKIKIIETRLGLLEIVLEKKLVVSARFIKRKSNISDIDSNSKIKTELDNYFGAVSRNISLEYKLNGTPFQKLVWKEISKIPYGETKTYSQIACAIGRPKSYRAVANACAQNNLTLIIPCHRVVGKNNLGGYEWGIKKKKWLIDFENRQSIKN